MGGGAGLHTLARRWAIQAIYGIADAGRVNGSPTRSSATCGPRCGAMARYDGFVRAGGPVAVALLYEQGGAVSVFRGLAAALLRTASIMSAFIGAPPQASTNAA